MPKSENGANDAKFFTRQSGNSISVVTPMSEFVRVVVIEKVDNNPRIESANIIE
jgi:hypothetical protein